MARRLGKIYNIALTTFLLGMICAVSAGTVFNVLKDHRPPVDILAQTNAGIGVYRPGEPLRIKITIRKRRACPGIIVRNFVNRETGERVQGATGNLGLTPPGETQTYIIKTAVPEGVGPGEWVYRSVLEWECADGPYILHQPDVEFRVTP